MDTESILGRCLALGSDAAAGFRPFIEGALHKEVSRGEGGPTKGVSEETLEGGGVHAGRVA